MAALGCGFACNHKCQYAGNNLAGFDVEEVSLSLGGRDFIMQTQIRTVIIPAAGQGSRMLPLTKVVPKELLPVYDRPVLQFALDEAAAVGAERIVVILHPSKAIIRQYLTRDDAKIKSLWQDGKKDLAEKLRSSGVSADAEVVFVMQHETLGLGHAVLCAAPHVLPGPVGVILPDDVIMGLPCLSQMAAAYQSGHMIAAMDVPLEDTGKYGIFRPIGSLQSRSVRVSGMVEKPGPDAAPSTLAAVGRYILDPGIFAALANTPKGSGGEIQLTDAIAADAKRQLLTAFQFAGTRFDCGSLEGLLEAGVAQDLKHAGKANPSNMADVPMFAGEMRV